MAWRGGDGTARTPPGCSTPPPLPYRALTPAPVVPITVMDPTAWSAAPKASWASAAPSTNTRTAAGSAGPAMRTAPVGVWGGWGQRGGGGGMGRNGGQWREMGRNGGEWDAVEAMGRNGGNEGEWRRMGSSQCNGGLCVVHGSPPSAPPPPLPQVHRATAAGLPGGCTAQCQVWGL